MLHEAYFQIMKMYAINDQSRALELLHVAGSRHLITFRLLYTVMRGE